MNIQREKTEQGIQERRAEKNGMENIESRKNRKVQKEQITTDFEFLDQRNIEKRGKIKNRVMHNNSSLPNQQDLWWENTSRYTSEELQELEDYFLQSHLNLRTC